MALARARRLGTAALAAFVLLAAGCGDDTVRLAFRPHAGATFTYAANLTTATTTELEGQAPDVEHQSATFASEHRVVDAGGDQFRVAVTVLREGAADRTYVARFDRGAQLTDVEEVDGIPTAALGDLGLTEIFPAAAGAPPARGLHPGDRWTIREQLTLPGSIGPVALTGEGRLVELGVLDGRPTAIVLSTTTLPVATTTTTPGGVQKLTGTQTTVLHARYDVDDGSIVSADAVTIGRFQLVLSAPAGQKSDPINGSITVEVHSTITRTG